MREKGSENNGKPPKTGRDRELVLTQSVGTCVMNRAKDSFCN